MKKWLAAMLLLITSLSFGQQFTQVSSLISAQGTVGRTGAASSGQFYTGDGGKNIQLAVLMPEALGIVPEYLPIFIQGLLHNNFSKYSAMTIVDPQYLNRIITEQNIGANGRFSENDYISIGKITGAQYFCVGNIQKTSNERFLLELYIRDSGAGSGKTRFIRDSALDRIEGSGALINEAVAEFLAQLGVTLNEAGNKAILAGNNSAVKSEAFLARGIIAQAKGSPVEALLNISLSAAFNPSRAEALSRLKTLSSEVSGGITDQRIQNDKQARERWLEAFKETTRFFYDHPPFEIIFDPNMIQEGVTDYENRTANLGMRIALDPSKTGFGALNTLLEGLEKTGKRKDWGFSGWPLLYVNPRVPGAVVFMGKKSFSYRVDAVLLNESNRTIGRGNITLKVGDLNFFPGDKKINILDGDAGMMRFTNVNIDALTPALTIVIIAINGVSTQDLGASGYMKIDTGDLEKRTLYRIGYRGPAGGIIFYDKGRYTDGWRYLEAAPNDLGSAAWGAVGKDIPGTETAVGSGRQNTQLIVARLKALGETGKAAQLCAELNINGFADWFLPSKNELDLLYRNLQQNGWGRFQSSWYWSSSQDNKNKLPWNQYFNSGNQHLNRKDYTLYVRAIRAF